MDPADTDYAWAAGFLDGEGSFVFKKVQNTDRRHACISADQTVIEPLLKLEAILGGSVSGPLRFTSAGNPIYRWVMSGSDQIRNKLPNLLPYLTFKRERAELLLEHASTFSRSYNKGIPKEILAQRKELENKFYRLREVPCGG